MRITRDFQFSCQSHHNVDHRRSQGTLPWSQPIHISTFQCGEKEITESFFRREVRFEPQRSLFIASC